MGLNTAVIVRNDFLDEIERDPAFGSKMRDAINDASCGHETGYYGQGFTALPSIHADYTQVVLIGRNSIERWDVCWSDDKDRILKELAEKMGYRLVRKKARAQEEAETTAGRGHEA